MGDSHGTTLAFALILFWMAGVAFFVAFHPGGVHNTDGSPAQNPVDIVKWLLTKGDTGASATAGSAAEGSGGSVTA